MAYTKTNWQNNVTPINDTNLNHIEQGIYDLDQNKQDTLVGSGTGQNLKTINNNNLLGSGNVSVQPTLVSGTNIKTINSNSILGSGNIDINEIYSTNETVVGTWIDGKPVYRRVFTGTGNGLIATMSYVDQIINMRGVILATYGQWWDIPNYHGETRYWATFNFTSSEKQLNLNVGDFYTSTSPYIAIIEYTKTTD